MSLNVLVLDSVGSCVDTNGVVYPLDSGRTPDMSDGVHIYDTTNEWWENVSMDDALELFPFLVETDLYHEDGYLIWAVDRLRVVEESCNEYVCSDWATSQLKP